MSISPLDQVADALTDCPRSMCLRQITSSQSVLNLKVMLHCGWPAGCEAISKVTNFVFFCSQWTRNKWLLDASGHGVLHLGLSRCITVDVSTSVIVNSQLATYRPLPIIYCIGQI